MTDIRPYLPDAGTVLCELLGGPYDKLGIRFDEPPDEIMLDGHYYRAELTFKTEDDCFTVVAPNDAENTEGTLFNVHYRYDSK